MKVYLPVQSFSGYKVLAGALYLMSVIFFPVIALYSFFIALLVGRAHGLGAWLGMWRGKRITWKFVVNISLLTILFSYWGAEVVSYEFLTFFTTALFAVHFFFDEYELQEEKISHLNLLAGFTPFITIFIYLIDSYFKLGISLTAILLLSVTLLLVELIHLEKIDWFFVQSKVHLLFVWMAIFQSFSVQAILGVLLTFHYFFWFIFPVYKLHKYKREERDGMIMILLLLISTTVYFALTNQGYGEEVYILAVKAFMIGTIIHILSTAPFGYFFGLKKPNY
jgi:hypothetical protein